ncbi:MAG: hypothetical protein OHK0046_33360 [Anaerolineae bacterium]
MGFLAFAAVFCALIPFVVLPSIGAGVALPVIEVPGEVVVEDFLPGFNLTNTIIGTVVTDIIVLLTVIILWRASKGWTKEVPGRAQAMFEVLAQGLYNFLYGIGGEKLRKTAFLWPLVATIFIFLLLANYMKLMPGVETVGYMHCAHVGQSGYPMTRGWTDGSYRLWIDAPLNAGTEQTEEMEHACELFYNKGDYERYPADENLEEIEARLIAAEESLHGYEDAVAVAQAELAAVREEIGSAEPTEEQEERLQEAEHALEEAELPLEKAEYRVEYQEIRIVSAESLPGVNAALALVEARQEAGVEGEATEAEVAEGEEAETESSAGPEGPADDEGEGEANFEALQEAAESGPGGEPIVGADLSDVRAELEHEAAALESALTALQGTLYFEMLEEREQDVFAAMDAVEAAETTEEYEAELGDLENSLVALRDFHMTQMSYPTATLVFTPDQLETTALPFVFHITPFVRGPATDLSLTIALALISVIMVQVYGVAALGPAYFEKFINLGAIGNVGKRPLGVIDFVVGLIEIISEIGKIVSLAFRLFGNLFAGGVALIAVTFLLALFVPGIIYGLELIIGGVQALVFAVLTVVFSVQAMEGHHGDEDHEHEAAH